MAVDFSPAVRDQQIQQNPGLWAQIKTAWQDPNVRAAVQQAGIQLMRSPKYGESGWDTGADALTAGFGTLAQLRDRDRARSIEEQDRKTKEEQRKIENNRGDRTVAVAEKNASTNETNVQGDQKARETELKRLEAQLAEAKRHNMAQEEIDRMRAKADQLRASIYGSNSNRTPAEIEKLNRLKKYYQSQNPGMSEEDADKAAFDYLQTSKGKSPRQLVIDAYQKKAQMWMEQQFDPTAQPTPEQRELWKKQAMEEVKFAEEAGSDVTGQRGTIKRPGTPSSAPTPPTSVSPAPAPGPGQPSPATATPQAPLGQNPATLRSIEKWKLNNATPEQIKLLIASGGEQPQAYGY